MQQFKTLFKLTILMWFVGLQFGYCEHVSAAAANSEKMQNATIGSEGASIYQSADFDSAVIGSLPPGKKVKISQKGFSGKGGLGAFFKIQIEGGQTGFVTDVDVLGPSKGGGGDGEKSDPAGFQGEDEPRKRKRDRLKPILFTRYFGLGAGIVNFTEKFSGQKLRSNLTMYNLRFTGPGVLFDEIPLDLNISFSPSAPKYYRYFSQAPPSGLVFIGDTSLLIPFIDGDSAMIYGGLGLMVAYSRVRVQINGDFVDSQEVRVGADFVGGLALRVAKLILRGDVKYYFEKNPYLGYWGTLQYEF